MASKKRKAEQLDPLFSDIVRETMWERANKGLAKKIPKELSMREATFLMRTAPSFKDVLSELKTLPKRRKLR